MNENPFFKSQLFLKTFWECGRCHEKHQGKYAITHAQECKKWLGDTVKFDILKKARGGEKHPPVREDYE